MDITPANHDRNMVDIFSAMPGEIREKIEAFEEQCKQMPQVKLQANHLFANGMYLRELFIPKGTTGTGALHLTEHFSMIVYGDISVLTAEGTVRMKGPLFRVVQPGTKACAFAHEDTLWVTVHRTDAQTVEEVERTLVKADFTSLPYAGQHQLKLKEN